MNTNTAEKIQLPWIQTYGNYSSDNYGAHALQVRIGNATVWFSYHTPIAWQPARCAPERFNEQFGNEA